VDEPGLIDRAWDRFTEFLSDLLSIVTGGSAFGGVVLGWVVLGSMLVLIVVLLWRFAPRVRSIAPARVTATVTTEPARKSRREWLVEASDAEARGSYAEAVAARYHALVAGLIERRQLPDAAGATPTELRDAFDAEARRRDPFASATDAFSDIWYGGETADAGDSSQMLDWDTRVLPDGGTG
jgi:hypothetical protein